MKTKTVTATIHQVRYCLCELIEQLEHMEINTRDQDGVDPGTLSPMFAEVQRKMKYLQQTVNLAVKPRSIGVMASVDADTPPARDPAGQLFKEGKHFNKWKDRRNAV